MHENYEQRLKDQRARMETELLSSHEEVQELRASIDQLKAIGQEIVSLKELQERKNSQIIELQAATDGLREELERKEDLSRIQKREIEILKQEQERLLKELGHQQDLLRAAQRQAARHLRMSSGNLNQRRDSIIDIEDLKKAADEIMHDQHTFNTEGSKAQIPN